MSAAGWLERIRGRGRAEVETPRAEPVVRTAPGITALFESLSDDRTHAVLDLGAASEASLAAYSRIARQVRFADLGATPSGLLHWDFPLEEAAQGASEPYDVLFVWDTFGRLPAEERERMVARLAELAAPSARLHMVLEAPEHHGPRPHGFSLVDTGRMRHELTWDDPGASARLLPSAVDRMLLPFEVVRAFTLKDGLREYVAVRRAPTRAALGTRHASNSREQLPAARAGGGIPPGYKVARTASLLEVQAGTGFAKGTTQIHPSPESIR